MLRHDKLKATPSAEQRKPTHEHPCQKKIKLIQSQSESLRDPGVSPIGSYEP